MRNTKMNEPDTTEKPDTIETIDLDSHIFIENQFGDYMMMENHYEDPELIKFLPEKFLGLIDNDLEMKIDNEIGFYKRFNIYRIYENDYNSFLYSDFYDDQPQMIDPNDFIIQPNTSGRFTKIDSSTIFDTINETHHTPPPYIMTYINTNRFNFLIKIY